MENNLPWRILLFSTIIKLILLLPSMLFNIDYLGKEIQMSSNYGNQLTWNLSIIILCNNSFIYFHHVTTNVNIFQFSKKVQREKKIVNSLNESSSYETSKISLRKKLKNIKYSEVGPLALYISINYFSNFVFFFILKT